MTAKEMFEKLEYMRFVNNSAEIMYHNNEETNENKAQDVFFKDDDYCENNCNDDYTKCWLKYFKRMQELEKGDSNE